MSTDDNVCLNRPSLDSFLYFTQWLLSPKYRAYRSSERVSLKSFGLLPSPVGTQRRKGCQVGFVCTPSRSPAAHSWLCLALPVSPFKQADTRGVAVVPSSCDKISHLYAGLCSFDGQTLGKPSPCVCPHLLKVWGHWRSWRAWDSWLSLQRWGQPS